MYIVESAHAYIREHPERFLRGPTATGIELSERLAGDTLILGASRTVIFHASDHFAVGSDICWLPESDYELHRRFFSFVPFPEAGENSFHSEVLIGAYSHCFWVVLGQPPSRVTVVGEEGIRCGKREELGLGLPEWTEQAVVFSLADHETASL